MSNVTSTHRNLLSAQNKAIFSSKWNEIIQHIVAFGEEEFLNEPLYFEGTYTNSPHFQSIRPLAEKFYEPTCGKS